MFGLLWLLAIVRHLLDGPALRRAEQRVAEALAQAERAEQGRREALAELAALRAERDVERDAGAGAQVAPTVETRRTLVDVIADWQVDQARAALHTEEASPTPRPAGDAVVLVREPFVPNAKVAHETLALVRADATARELRRQLTHAQRNNHARNVALDALHFVWCNGGCDTGVHRYDGAGPDAVTREVVEAAIRNTERLIAWYQNHEARAGRPHIPTTWEEMALRPRVGLSVLLRRRSDGALLFGLRKGSHGASTWAPPGGHLEPDESIVAGAIRELEEEAGAVPSQITSAAVLGVFTHDQDIGPTPYITLYVVVEIEDFEPQIREPDKCAAWLWVRPNDPKPEPLFGPIRRLITRGVNPHAAHLLAPIVEP